VFWNTSLPLAWYPGISPLYTEAMILGACMKDEISGNYVTWLTLMDCSPI
jgi:hypothetical protein